MNKLHQLILSMMILMVAGGAVPAWACDALGPNRHIGVVTKIDPGAHSFTIIDAQRNKPMTFTAPKKILDALQLEQEFVVTFRMEGRQMQAVAIVPFSRAQTK